MRINKLLLEIEFIFDNEEEMAQITKEIIGNIARSHGALISKINYEVGSDIPSRIKPEKFN